MPILRYSLQIKGEQDALVEQDTFQPTNDPTALITEKVLNILKANRLKTGEPDIELINVEVVNPYVHLHTWRKTRKDAFTCKNHYVCDRCGITGFKKINIMTGEIGGLTRDEPYHSERKYTYCHDPLKKMPTSTGLVFR